MKIEDCLDYDSNKHLISIKLLIKKIKRDNSYKFIDKNKPKFRKF